MIDEKIIQLHKKSIELKIKDEIAMHLGLDSEDIFAERSAIKTLVLVVWNADWRNPPDKQTPDELDRFDGFYYESEYFVQFIIRCVGERLNLEFDLDDRAPTITVRELKKIAYQLKGLE